MKFISNPVDVVSIGGGSDCPSGACLPSWHCVAPLKTSACVPGTGRI